MKKLTAVFMVLCMLVFAAGCGNKPQEAASGEKPLKVALCVTGPINDGGWCQVAYESLQRAEELYGIEITYTENLEAPDMEAALTDYASQGYDLICSLGFQFGDPAVTVSKKYPDKKFIVFEGAVEGENLQSCMLANEQSRYCLGYLAALITETGTVGIVGATESASIIKSVEAFKLGAKDANPNVKVLSAYTGSFSDVALAKEAAMAMIDQNADVIGHCANTSGTGVIKACEERGIRAFGATQDQNALAPNTVVTGDVQSFGDVLLLSVKDVLDGKFKGGIVSYGFPEGIMSLAPFHSFEDKIPQKVKDEINKVMQEITDGTRIIPVISKSTN